MKSYLVAIVSVFAGLCAASAQSVPDALPQLATAQVVPIHTAAPDRGLDYGLWAAGGDYKASFHDGMTFVPMLGKDYPHNQPMRWTTTSVRHGDSELVTQPPRASHTDTRAEFDLGHVVEAYDVRLEGLEQSFVIATRIGAGDLVVRGRFESQLRVADCAPAVRALEFVDELDQHLVSYGAATAIDARGRTCAMTTGVEAGELTLRLAGQWLDEATFPVTVDPVLSTAWSLFGNAHYDVDVAHDPESNVHPVWLCYTTYASATDGDIYLRRWSDDGSDIDPAFSDLSSNWSSQGGSCAFSHASDRGVVVFDRLFSGGGGRWLRFHTHDRGDPTNNTTVTGIPSTGYAWRCDVGGTESLGGPEVLVVWQQESGSGTFQNGNDSSIHGCVIDTAANTTGAAFPIADVVFSDFERPSVNQTTYGLVYHWLVAYQAISVLPGQDDWDVEVRQVHQSGFVSARTLIYDSSPLHKMTPRIEGRSGRYLVAFVTSATVQQPGAPGGTTGHALRVTRLDWPAGGTPTQQWGTILLEQANDARIQLGGLGFDRNTSSHWVLTYRSTVTDTIYVRSVGYRGKLLLAETVATAPNPAVSVVGGVSFDELGDRFVLAYAHNNLSGVSHKVRYDYFEHSPVAPATATGIACSPAAISWVGSQHIGSQLSHLRVLGAASDSLHVMAMALAPASQVLVGIPLFQSGCWLSIPNVGPDFVGLFDLKFGANPVYFLPLPESLASDTFYFQDFHTVGNGDLTLLTTQRLAVPIAK